MRDLEVDNVEGVVWRCAAVLCKVSHNGELEWPVVQHYNIIATLLTQLSLLRPCSTCFDLLLSFPPINKDLIYIARHVLMKWAKIGLWFDLKWPVSKWTFFGELFKWIYISCLFQKSVKILCKTTKINHMKEKLSWETKEKETSTEKSSALIRGGWTQLMTYA